MSSSLTVRPTMAAKWSAAKPMVTGLVIGLIAGPTISGLAGFQFRTSAAQPAARAGIVEQPAAFWAERARTSGAVTGTLSSQTRNNLARRFAVMPETTAPDSDVVYACSTKLSA